MFHSGQWQTGSAEIEVTNPFDGSVIDTVPDGSTDDITAAIDGLVDGAGVMRRMAAWKRSDILSRCAALLRDNESRLAELISSEEGKAIRESRAEVRRSASTMQLSAEEAKRLTGEVVPLDATPGGENKLGFTLRVPCGIVAAITPFNFPLNLVCHKVGPALAAGNSILVKPATDTPLSALALVELLLEAGLPAETIACVTGSGSRLGAAICRDERIRKISFTGSADVGRQICEMAGLKRVTMELGSNSPLVVLPDADLEKVAAATCSAGFTNAGQVCISAQRLIVAGQVHDELAEKLAPMIERIPTGNQLEKTTHVGPMVRESDAERVGHWIDEAVSAGANVISGGERSGAIYHPTLITGASPDMRIVKDELFGPAVAMIRADDVEHSIKLAADTRFGLSAAVYTNDVTAAMKFANGIDSGNIHINGGPQWRADGMPYGGLKESGIGKEGPKYAVQEMTETKMVVFHGLG